MRRPTLRRRRAVEPERSASLGFDEWVSWFKYGGLAYSLGFRQTLQGSREEIAPGYGGLVAGAYKGCGVVFACCLVRQLLFSEARFQFRQIRNGRPGKMFGTAALEPLERPWPGGTTGDLLGRMIQDADLAGNAFVVRRGGGVLRRLRPDWVTIVLGSGIEDPEVAAGDLDAEVIGYMYVPGGPASGNDPVILQPSEVAHFAPIPDPTASYRGMSWLTPVITEILGDKAASGHKIKFFENGATPNLVVNLPDTVKEEAFNTWARLIKEGHEGVDNAYKTLILGGGAQATVVGVDLKQLDFKIVQGAGETRIAAASGVPPVIVGLSEGLASATYSNYGMARRRLADGTMRPLWRNAAGSLAQIIQVPPGAELWYDDTDIAFVQEDQKDAADIMATKAGTVRSLTDAGFVADSVIAAVEADDLTLLVHSGNFSVQLQPAGAAGANGNGAAPVPAK